MALKDWKCVFMACNSFGVHESVTFGEAQGCTDVLTSLHFKIMTQDLGNYLNVFIVFY